MTKDDVEYKLPDDWRGKMMARIRELMKQADPEVVEEIKYKTATNPGGVLVWYKSGMICTGELYKKHLRLGFAKGPSLKDQDPKGLINTYRAIVIQEENEIDSEAFKNLVRAAVELNVQAKSKK
jgi:hypothetical protein